MNTKNEKVYLAYLDDGDQRVTGFFSLLDISNGLVTFETRAGNKIAIPSSRILKIRRGGV